MKKILWLASWYPNETDPYTGDFIRRMAEAVSLYMPLQVIFVGKSAVKKSGLLALGPVSKSLFSDLHETLVYYTMATEYPRMLNRVKSLFLYFRKHKSFIDELKSSGNLPDMVHVQVSMKSGLIALYLNKRYHIPYIITEHWSGYYEQSRNSLFRKSFIEKYLTRRILKNASLLLPVSNDLGNQISHYWASVPFRKIPNVVNTIFFHPVENRTPKRFRFIHVSSLLYPKNPEAIVSAFGEVLHLGFEAELVLVGPMNNNLKNFIQEMAIPQDRLLCKGEVSYEQVAVEMQSSSAFVMFSFYENMPCSILEALCTGLPVIASSVGGIPEIISEENGILVTPGHEEELKKAMQKMILQGNLYDHLAISKKATAQFSYEVVGKEITEVYQELWENV